MTRLAEIATRRGNTYVPIRLRCTTEEILRRVPAPERRERLKWIDQDAVRAFIDGHELLRLDGYDPFDLDVTTLDPDDAARQILDHIAAR